jgi:probable biosynthetic protein (TIGR04099 family)
MHSWRTDYIAGMPQLAYTGLSENWLLKECGDLHWRGLAALAGHEKPEFRDADGRKAYAAFLAVRLREARLESLAENTAFAIDSSLARVAGARHFSRHLLSDGQGRHAEVSMLSTFVRRERDRDNRSVVRAAFAESSDALSSPDAAEMGALARRFRAGDWGCHLGLEQGRDDAGHSVEYLPCPYSDFNGADLLYFASFQAIADRAAWQWRPADDPPVVAERDLFFHGNVNVGEALELSFSAMRTLPDGLAHWCEVRRGSDGGKIADVVTRKRWRVR